MKKNKIYTVIAYRYGDNSSHSYTLGVFNKKEKAIKCADSHTEYRGMKYSCHVEQCELNGFDNDKDEYTKTVYKTKSAMCV